MTDKQIIIDGIDVSGCPHIEYDHKWWDIAGREQNSENVCSLSFDNNTDFDEDFLCKDNPNCDYKQLKRAEQRIVELNKTIKAKEQECEAYKMEAEEGKEINAELKAENYELKKANLHIENNREHKANKLNRIEKLILVCTTGYTDEFIKELLVILHEPEPVSFKNKYLQTLTEIKEIVKPYSVMQYDGCVIVNVFEDFDKILQKIRECEVER